MNIANHVERIARTAPERKAIVFEGKDISYGALDACANVLASALQANGVNRGDRGVDQFDVQGRRGEVHRH